MNQSATLRQTVDFKPAAMLTHLIELQGHIETLTDAADGHASGIDEAVNRSQQILRWMFTHGLYVEGEPAGGQSRIALQQKLRDAMQELRNSYGLNVSVKQASSAGAFIAEDGAPTIAFLSHCELHHGSALDIAELISAELHPEKYPPHHSALVRRGIQARSSTAPDIPTDG
ncbi:MAG: hypothetical protein AAF589_04745, partial [Planctomycetota bacterium]